MWRHRLGEPRFSERFVMHWGGTFHLSLAWLMNRLKSCLWLQNSNNFTVKDYLNVVNYHKNGVQKRFICHELFRTFMLDEQEKMLQLLSILALSAKKRKKKAMSLAKSSV